MTKIEFGMGAVAVPRNSLSGEFVMISSHLENGGKREGVIRGGKLPQLTQVTGDFYEFPGGAMERRHWRGAHSLSQALLNTVREEIWEEMDEQSLACQFVPVKEKIAVLQKRKDSYVFFLVSLFWWEMDLDYVLREHGERMPAILTPQDYLAGLTTIKSRPRDAEVATIYSRNYLNGLM